MSVQIACGLDILWTVGWIAFNLDVVVLWVFLMIWLTFGEEFMKTRWPTEDILKKMLPKKLMGVISYETLDRTQICWGGSLGISDDLINFRE